ncbi:MAG: Tat pathway signal sequence [Selenomonadaceae bacterium]|nr:Tat pathway signal sequence [Selenomonadaceae bacterium]
MSEKKLRIIMALVGVILTGVCVGIFQTVLLGADPFTCFVTGIANIFNSTYSTWYVIIIGLLLVVVFILQRRYIGIATIINLFGIGFMADFTHWIMSNLIVNPSMTFRLILLIVNIIILSAAASLYFTADLGVSAYDAIALMAANDYKVAAFRVCRITTDLICVIVGWIYAADIGLGTVITAFMMGPIIQWFNENVSEPLLNSKRRTRQLR